MKAGQDCSLTLDPWGGGRGLGDHVTPAWVTASRRVTKAQRFFFFSLFSPPIPQAVKHTSKGNVLRPWHRVDSASAKVSLWTRSLAGVDTFPWRSLRICLISKVRRSRDEALPNELQDRCDWARRPGSASPPALISRQSGKTALRKVQFLVVFLGGQQEVHLILLYFETTTNRCVKCFNVPLFKDLFLKLHSKHFPSGVS